MCALSLRVPNVRAILSNVRAVLSNACALKVHFDTHIAAGHEQRLEERGSNGFDRINARGGAFTFISTGTIPGQRVQ